MIAFLVPVKRRKAPLQNAWVFFSVGRVSWDSAALRGSDVDMGRGREVVESARCGIGTDTLGDNGPEVADVKGCEPCLWAGDCA